MNYGYYNYGYTTTSSDALAAIAGMGVAIGIISLVISVIVIVSLWKIFKKAGKNGWEAIVPVYNFIVLLEICELPIWQIVLFIIPVANIYIMFKIYIELAKKFGKDTGFGVLTAFFPYVCLPILAFSDAKYESSTTNSETQSSILDVDEEGVPNNSESSNFSYGYEKEETVVMQPVTEETEVADETESTKDTDE